MSRICNADPRKSYKINQPLERPLPNVRIDTSIISQLYLQAFKTYFMSIGKRGLKKYHFAYVSME